MFKSFVHTGVIMLTTLFLITPSFPSNVYYMMGRVDTKQADNFHKFMDDKKDLNPDTNRILLVLSGNGGEIRSMERIIKTIDSSKLHIDTFALNRLASADANLFLMGENRYDVNAVLYYHQAWGIHPVQKELDRINSSVKHEIEKHSGLDNSTIDSIFKTSGVVTEIDSREAFNLGISTSHDIPDMSIYKNVSEK